MKNAFLLMILVAISSVGVARSLAPQIEGKSSTYTMLDNDQVLSVSGETAAVLYRLYSQNPEDVDRYHDDKSVTNIVYKGSISCAHTITKRPKSSSRTKDQFTNSYSCSITLKDGVAMIAPRG